MYAFLVSFELYKKYANLKVAVGCGYDKENWSDVEWG